MYLKKASKFYPIILYSVAAAIVLFGFGYTSYPTRAVVTDPLDPQGTRLVATLFRVIGAVLMAVGVSVAILSYLSLNRGHRWARWAGLVSASAVLVPLLVANLDYDLHTSWGLTIPWWLPALLTLLIVIVALGPVGEPQSQARTDSRKSRGADRQGGV